MKVSNRVVKHKYENEKTEEMKAELEGRYEIS